MILRLTQTFTLAKLRRFFDCLAISLIPITLMPALVVPILMRKTMLRMNDFLIKTLGFVMLMMKLVLNWDMCLA